MSANMGYYRRKMLPAALLPCLLAALLMPLRGDGAEVTPLTTELKKNLVMQLDAALGVEATSNGTVTGWNDLAKKSPKLGFQPGCTVTPGDIGAVRFDGETCYAYSPSYINGSGVHIRWSGDDRNAPFTIAIIYRSDAYHADCAAPADLLYFKSHASKPVFAEAVVNNNLFDTYYANTTTEQVLGEFTYEYACPPTGTWVLDVLTRTSKTGQYNFYRYTAAGGPSSSLKKGATTVVSGDVLTMGAVDNYVTLKGDVAVVLLYNNLLKPATVTNLAKAYSPRFGLWTSNSPPPPPPTPLPADIKKALVYHLDGATTEYDARGFAISWPDLLGVAPALTFREGCVRTIGNIGAVRFDGTGCYAYSPGVFALPQRWYGEAPQSPFSLAVLYRLDPRHTCENPAQMIRLKSRPERTNYTADTCWESNNYTYSDSNTTTPTIFSLPCAPTEEWVLDVLTRTHKTGIYTFYRFSTSAALTTTTRNGPNAIVSGDVLNIGGGPSTDAKQLKGDVAVFLAFNQLMKPDLVKKLAATYASRFDLRV